MYINEYRALKRKVPLNVERNLYRFLDLNMREIQEFGGEKLKEKLYVGS